MLAEVGILNREVVFSSEIAVGITRLGAMLMVMGVPLSLLRPMLAGRAALPAAECTIWELVVRLRESGWACVPHEGRPAPTQYRRAGAKQWYLKTGAKSISRFYLVALLAADSNDFEVFHFEKDSVYRCLLGMDAKKSMRRRRPQPGAGLDELADAPARRRAVRRPRAGPVAAAEAPWG